MVGIVVGAAVYIAASLATKPPDPSSIISVGGKEK